MPVDWKKYPKNWRNEIRPRILERDGHKCKWCGLPNYSIVLQESRTLLTLGFDFKSANQNVHFYHDPLGEKAIVIVLTIAHLDHDTTNNADENLAALCQKCHLGYDAELHATNAKKTREKNSPQLNLFT